MLRLPGGSVSVFSTPFNKAVLLAYAFTLDPYNNVYNLGKNELQRVVALTLTVQDTGAS